jgi:hypothetical protein
MQESNSFIRLGYSILVGPIVWAVHFMSVWVMSEFGCRANFNNVVFYPAATIRTGIIVATVIALLLVSVGAVLALRNWGERGTTRRMDEDERETLEYLTVTGLLMSSLFLFVIFVSSMPNFILNVCDRVL